MSAMTPDEAAGRRVDAKFARSNERLDRYYSKSPSADRKVETREKFLQSRALRAIGGSGTHEAGAH